jgi:hypothetical protein
LDKVPQCIGIDLKPLGNLSQAFSLFIETLDLTKALLKEFTPLLLGGGQTKARGNGPPLLLGGILGLFGWFEGTELSSHDGIQRQSHILKGVPAIGNLDGLWGSCSSTFRIRSRTITADHFHSRVLDEPESKGLRSSIRQEIDHPVGLQKEYLT